MIVDSGLSTRFPVGQIMTTEQLTEDVASLKQSVAELQRKMQDLERQPKSNWLPHVLGRFADFPEFEEIVKFGEEFRKTGGFPDDEIDYEATKE